MPAPAILVHGGCGNPSGGTIEHEADYHEALSEAVLAAAALAASMGGLSAELIEAATHLAFYAGWPSAVTAIGTAREVFNPARP